MKIYRAVFTYNNADTCEWEDWYKLHSTWYSKKCLAEKHLHEFEKYKDYLKNDYYKQREEYFLYEEPHIETIEVKDNFVPIEIDYENIYNNGRLP